MKTTASLFGVIALATIAVSGPLNAGQSIVPHAVVELYTSQGCNSCPPADRVLHELNQEHNDLLLLSYHVDYWNYLGWTDPFSDAFYSARQREYANHMRERYVYTPQVIINGDHVVRATAKQRIEATSRSLAPLPDVVDIDLSNSDTTKPAQGTVTLVRSEKSSAASTSLVWMVGFDNEHQRDVLSGENAGKRLVHANVVREMIGLGHWDGARREIPFAMTTPTDGGIAVLVQDGRGGPIVAASLIRF
ncbi:DUF1223 domain-containing protein [Thalassospira australica]|uniref:DUF1223 domain-containing protein n=1 Tax=Thalassospira australica TaxID=1528106 RepID=UPI00051A331D|nr:DUF1223 domain-containing protein [Thalassospira australica]